MKSLSIVVVLTFTVIAVTLTRSQLIAAPAASSPPANVQATCVQPPEAFAGKSVEQWRAEGPAGLAALIKAMAPSIRTYSNAESEQSDQQAEAKAHMLFLDRVAQQRDAYASGLYWYTDLDMAIEEAGRTGRPILSLRMLGKLVDEYSCANSRFFRTVLYADQTVGDLLREKFVLHWESVRPVPVITIDMGDGRTIKRTITGNSAHYVLDPAGRVIDCLPGLYGPDTFERLVTQAADLAVSVKEDDDVSLTAALASYHREQRVELDRTWNALVGGQPVAVHQLVQNNSVRRDNPPAAVPTALEASTVALSKGLAETPMIRTLIPTPQPTEAQPELWERVAQHYASESRLDLSSRSLLLRKLPTAEQAAPIGYVKKRVESPLLRVVRNFEGSIAMDTTRNEHLLHRRIHGWFMEAEAPLDLAALNRRVYAELFLTPDEDPWLGLVPADTYTALDHGGLSD